MSFALVPGFETLRINPSAYLSGMGAVDIAYSPQPSASLLNPANAAVERPSVSLDYGIWLEDTSYFYAGFFYPFEFATLGLALFQFNSRPLTETSGFTPTGLPLERGLFSAFDVKLGFLGARSFRFYKFLVSSGVSLNFLMRQIYNNKGVAFSVTAGAVARLNRMFFAFTLTDFGTKIRVYQEAVPLSSSLRVSIGYRVFYKRFNIDFVLNGGYFLWLSPFFYFGTDFCYNKKYGFRFGFQLVRGEFWPAFGAGVFVFNKYSLSYSLNIRDALGIVHRFGLDITF